MTAQRASLDEIRGFYARYLTRCAKASDPRLERAFETIPREAFLPPGPWRIATAGGPLQTPSDDPAYLYQNVLVALDAEHGINNGEPALHAEWLAAVEPGAGETVIQIGAGTGYYTAILAFLVLPGGTVLAYEIDPALAAAAERNLTPFENVTVIRASATAGALPKGDLIYVNASVAAPPLSWIDALNPGGRLIFPWRLSSWTGVAIKINRVRRGLQAEPLSFAQFIACTGGPSGPVDGEPVNTDRAWQTGSLWRVEERAPDASATAIYRDVWFSTDPIED